MRRGCEHLILSTRGEAADPGSSMFKMTIYAIGRRPIAEGHSENGEDWEATLLRLYHQTLPPTSPERRVIYMTYYGGEMGSPTNMVILGYGPSIPDESTDPPVIIHTTPPQF